MPIEEQNVRIPESITINGVTYSVKETPALQTFIQEVAKVEKSKLYSQFEALRAEINNLKGVSVEKPIVAPEVNIQSIIDGLKGTFVTREALKEDLQSVVKEVVQPVLNATEAQRMSELEAYRQKLITENAATCIPDLVKGNTREELDAALKESIRLRTAYPSPVATPQGHVTDPLIQKQAQQQANGGANPQITPTPGNAPQPQAPAAPQMPAVPQRPSPEVTGPTGVKSMSMSEFESKRSALLDQLQATYGQN